MPEYFYDQIPTNRGIFTVLFSAAGIYELYFPGLKSEKRYPQKAFPWPDLAEDLNRYLAGKKVDWMKYPLDLKGYPPFISAVLQEVSRIPYGEVITYREAAERAGSPLAWRAAGQALKTNRHPVIVPCHRVVGSGGKIGGFSGPPGWKRMLLELEGAIKKDPPAAP